MRILTAFRVFTLLAFALFGGALPVAASGDHVVICGADGVKRVVAYDFETGKPVEVELTEADCQDCFGIAPLLIASPSFTPNTHLEVTVWRPGCLPVLSPSAVSLPPARAPPSLII